MIEFSITQKSKKSNARLGILKTPHGEVETPSLVPVATLATIKGMRSDEVLKTKSQMLISNTYHLHLTPGEKVVKDAGGLNKFMNWPRPTMTDSGGFQVFSLGFGRDLGVGKFENPFPTKLDRAIEHGTQPTSVKITERGVEFRSPVTGDQLFLGPKESVAIQEKIGADIIFAFDECTPPRVTRTYMEKSLDLTHRWAAESLKARRSKQAIYGIVQGSVYKDLREKSARFMDKLGFDGFGIGGDLGDSINHSADDSTNGNTKAVLGWTLPFLDERKPRHLLGIGHLGDIETIIKCGVDTFDCTVPTHYARRGIAFTAKGPPGARLAEGGRLDFRKEVLLKDKNPIDSTCECLVCQNYRRNYIAHLIRANEVTGGSLITFHNLFFFNTYIEKVREKVRKGLL